MGNVDELASSENLQRLLQGCTAPSLQLKQNLPEEKKGCLSPHGVYPYGYPFREGNSFPAGGWEAENRFEGMGGGWGIGPKCREQGSTWWEELRWDPGR